jgi:hypothetical protein
VWNDLKLLGVFIGWWGRNLIFLDFFSDFLGSNGEKRLVFQFKWSNSYSNDQNLNLNGPIRR